jgi:4-hydroxybenzoate polyprenyltransferase
MMPGDQVSPANIFSVRFLGAYIITMRPYLLFVSGITGIAGLSFTSGLPATNLAVLFLVFFLSYGFGQALTDCFQIDTDTLSSPYRPLTQGILRKWDVLIVSLSGLLLSGLTLAYHSLWTLPLSLLATVGLATYTYFKKRWWGGPFYNAWIVSVLCLIAIVTQTSGYPFGSFDAAIALALAAIFFGYANFVLSGYFKDVSADRATGYNTFPVVFGFKASAIVSDIFAALFIVLVSCTLHFLQSRAPFDIFRIPSLVFATSGFAISLVAQILLYRCTSEEESHRSISLVVHSYILQLSAIAAWNKPRWAIFLILFYGGFVLTMKYRPSRSQV